MGYPVYWPVSVPLYMFSFMGNAFLTVLLCIERFVFIMYPAKSKVWCSKRKTLTYICLATLTSIILSIPLFFAFKWDKNGQVVPTDLAVKSKIIEEIFNFVCRFLLPTGILLTLSAIVAIKVRFSFGLLSGAG